METARATPDELPLSDRRRWGPGPWEMEPDREAWTDAATGLPCRAIRNVSLGGFWRGFVGVPEGHPAYGKSRWDLWDLDVLEVHGGVTYACLDPGDSRWYVGFDCAHAGDVVPGVGDLYAGWPADAVWQPGGASPKDSVLRTDPTGQPVYRDLAYVQAECARLAAQLAAMEGTGPA